MAEENDPFGYRTAAAPPDLRDTVDYLDKRVTVVRRLCTLLLVFFCVSFLFAVFALSMSERNRDDIARLAACRVMTDAETAAQQAALEERRRLTHQQDQELCMRVCPANPDREQVFVSAACTWGAAGLRACDCYCARATDSLGNEYRVTHTVTESR